MTRPGQVCSVPGCPELVPCRAHARISTRNHRGVPRQARGHGVTYERQVRTFRAEGRRCALQLPGCTGRATSGDYTTPGDWTSPLQPACLNCQRVQGAQIANTRR